MNTLPEALTLDAVWADAWQRLAAGATDRHAVFHLGVLASLSSRGPEARTVVLRFADASSGVLGFHTDVRSPKWTELQADPRASWVFYGDGVQVRVGGTVSLHAEDAVAEAAWLATGPFGRRCYGVLAAPGTITHTPTAGLPDGGEAHQAWQSNFGAARLTVASLDWLSLRADGHRRARFDRSATGWTAVWCQP